MTTFGDLVCRSVVVDDEERVYVDEAPPRIAIAFEVWQKIRNGRYPARRISLDLPAECIAGAWIDSAIGALVTITADNGEWIYRVTGCDYERDRLELEWPD